MTPSILWVAGLFGGILQIVGFLGVLTPWDPFAPVSPEMDGVISFCLWAIGVSFMAGALESILRQGNRSPFWALLSLAGPPAALLLLFLKPRAAKVARKSAPPSGMVDRISAWILTLGGFLFLSVSAWAWLSWENPYLFPEPEPAVMMRNERLAFDNIRRIFKAQETYHRTDWNGDGRSSYALFLVHLWGTLDRNSDPVPSRLIPRELAFAMAGTDALEGYYYVDLHERLITHDPGSGTTTELLDPEQEWAIMALPAAYGRTGSAAFMVSHEGTVYAKDAKIESGTLLPRDPAAMGWKSLGTTEEARWEGLPE